MVKFQKKAASLDDTTIVVADDELNDLIIFSWATLNLGLAD